MLGCFWLTSPSLSIPSSGAHYNGVIAGKHPTVSTGLITKVRGVPRGTEPRINLGRPGINNNYQQPAAFITKVSPIVHLSLTNEK